MDIDDPSPIRWIKPLSKAFLPAMIAFQVEDAPLGIEAWRKSVCGKYFPFSTLEHKESRLVRMRQPCLPSIARLNKWGSRKPKPPLIFGSVNLSHANQCKDFLSIELPHQYLAMGEVISLQTFLVSRKQLML